MKSENYYDKNADEFYNATCSVDLSDIYVEFEKYLKIGSCILDAGCGSGRDSKYFLSKGYQVSAIDASEEMVIRAKEYTGLEVQKMYFQDINDFEKYTAIWACASLLHVPKKDIDEIFTKFIQSLKTSGIWYMSFKYGKNERLKGNRLFNDYTEESLKELIAKYQQLTILKLWLTDDRREDRTDKWINIIVKKTFSTKPNKKHH